jgi:hypothetical protein
MREEMSGLRHRWHGFLRHRLERLRNRVDGRIARIEEKEQHLAVRTPAEPVGEAPKPPTRPRARRRATRSRSKAQG